MSEEWRAHVNYIPSVWISNQHDEALRRGNRKRSAITVCAAGSVITRPLDVVGSL